MREITNGVNSQRLRCRNVRNEFQVRRCDRFDDLGEGDESRKPNSSKNKRGRNCGEGREWIRSRWPLSTYHAVLPQDRNRPGRESRARHSPRSLEERYRSDWGAQEGCFSLRPRRRRINQAGMPNTIERPSISHHWVGGRSGWGRSPGAIGGGKKSGAGTAAQGISGSIGFPSLSTLYLTWRIMSAHSIPAMFGMRNASGPSGAFT